jgi:hypothetical protein
MAIPNELGTVRQLEAEGYFEVARSGDHRAPSLFARLVAFRLNPTGNPAGWGWLKKGGGKNVDGYSEDAIVFTADPSNLHNVVDVVAGAGASGARVQWNGPVPRRPEDVWEAPRMLTNDELAYLNGRPVEPAPAPTPTPTPTPVPTPEPVDLRPVISALQFLINEIATQRKDLHMLHEQLSNVFDQAANARLEIQDVRKAVDRPLTLEADAGWLGKVRGTVKP